MVLVSNARREPFIHKEVKHKLAGGVNQGTLPECVELHRRPLDWRSFKCVVDDEYSAYLLGKLGVDTVRGRRDHYTHISDDAGGFTGNYASLSGTQRQFN